MKKLNLEKLKLAAEDVLQRGQLSTIYGGSGGSGEEYKCCTTGGCSECKPCTSTCTCPLGTLTKC